MREIRKILLLPLSILIFVLESITRPIWNFVGGCIFFWICFKVANAGVEPGNISNALRVVFWNTVLGIVALQTLPQLFHEIFTGDE